jgi:hypothetical protein
MDIDKKVEKLLRMQKLAERYGVISREEIVVEAYAEFRSVHKVSELTGHGTETVSKILKGAGIELKRGRPPLNPDEVIAEKK